MQTTDTAIQPDLSVLFAIHHALAADATALAAAAGDLEPEDRAERIPTLQAFFERYTAQLVAHHTHEDDLFFPALEAKVGSAAMNRPALDAQHEQLGESIERVRSALAAIGDDRTDFAAAKARVRQASHDLEQRITTHLELEKRIAIPLYLKNISPAEHAPLELQAQASGTFEGLQFMVPWLFDRLPAAVRDRALGASPEIFAVVYADQVPTYRTYTQALSLRSGHQ